MVVWILGISGVGKTTIGSELRNQIRALGKSCVHLDGDIIRKLCSGDLSHSLADRKKNAIRICNLCHYLDSEEVNVVCGHQNAFHESQDWMREHVENYFEVYLNAPVELLKKRDSKGLYSRALRGEVKNVYGVDLEYTVPKAPNMTIEQRFDRDASLHASAILETIISQLH